MCRSPESTTLSLRREASAPILRRAWRGSSAPPSSSGWECKRTMTLTRSESVCKRSWRQLLQSSPLVFRQRRAETVLVPHLLPAYIPDPVHDFRLIGRAGYALRLPAGLGGKPPPFRALDVAAHEVAEDLSRGLALCFCGSSKLRLQGGINP